MNRSGTPFDSQRWQFLYFSLILLSTAFWCPWLRSLSPAVFQINQPLFFPSKLTCLFFIISIFSCQLQKIIINRIMIQIIPNFFSHAPWNVYYFMMWFSDFYHAWIFECDGLFDHGTKCYMLCHLTCEILILSPIAMKFCILVPNMLLDVWGLVVHF